MGRAHTIWLMMENNDETLPSVVDWERAISNRFEEVESTDEKGFHSDGEADL